MRASTPCGMSVSSSAQSYGYSSKRKQSSQSTPSSPTRARKAQCTCFTTEQQGQLQQQQLFASQSRGGAQTLPRNMNNSHDDISRTDGGRMTPGQPHSSYDSMHKRNKSSSDLPRNEGFGSIRDRDCQNEIKDMELNMTYQPSGSQDSSSNYMANINNGKAYRRQHSLKGRHHHPRSEYPTSHVGTATRKSGNRTGANLGPDGRKKVRSRSTDHLNYSGKENIDSGTLKRMLKPFHSIQNDSPLTSPEGGQGGMGRGSGFKRSGGSKHSYKYSSDRDIGFSSEPEVAPHGHKSRSQISSGSKRDSGYRRSMSCASGCNQGSGELFLDIQDRMQDSPPSDSGGIFDSNCFATTPSSSNGNSDIEGNPSPTSQLLMNYEEYLRNTLEKGMDAESFSLHTFEALLSRSMENLEQDLHDLGPGLNPKTSFLKKKGKLK